MTVRFPSPEPDDAPPPVPEELHAESNPMIKQEIVSDASNFLTFIETSSPSLIVAPSLLTFSQFVLAPCHMFLICLSDVLCMSVIMTFENNLTAQTTKYYNFLPFHFVNKRYFLDNSLFMSYLVT